MAASDEPQHPETTDRPKAPDISNDGGKDPQSSRDGAQTRLLPALIATASILGVVTLAALLFWPSPTNPSEIAAKETVASTVEASTGQTSTDNSEPAQTSPIPSFDLSGAYSSESQTLDSGTLPEPAESSEPSDANAVISPPSDRSDESTQPNDAPSNRTDTKGRSSRPAKATPPNNPTGPPKMVIEGPSTVDCWGPNHRYTVRNSGGPITGWLWNTGGLGLQSAATSGPSIYVSFDLDPGTYTIRVTANNTTTAIKPITVRAAPGCSGPQLKPILDGPGSATCGAKRQYSMRDGNGGPAYPMGWTESSIKVSRVEGSATDLMLSFPSSPGAYQMTVHVGNGPNSTTKAASTTRTFTVQC